MTRRAQRPDDEAPLFLIPRIPGTGLLALLGVGLVAMTLISAYMRSSSPQPAEPVVEDPEPEPITAPAVRLLGAPDDLLERLGAETVGHEMWRWPGTAGAVVFLLDGDALWAHDLADADLAMLESLGIDYEVEESAAPLP